MQVCLREIHQITALASCELRARHLSSEQNRIADCLSRIHKHEKFGKQFEILTKGFSKQEILVDESLFTFQYTEE